MAEQSRAWDCPKQASLKSALNFLNTAIQGVVNLVLLFVGLSCLTFGAWILWCRNDVTLAGTGLAAGLVLLLAASIDRFEVLKGLGMEARTRKLDAVLSQATGTIEQLRELAEISSSSIVAFSTMTRWDSDIGPREIYESIQRVHKNLADLGSAQETIHKILNPWVTGQLRDLIGKLQPTLREPLLLEQEKARIELQGRTDPASGEYQVALNKVTSYGSYEGTHFRALFSKPVVEWAGRLQTYVEEMPVPDSDRQRLLTYLRPWVNRMNYLASHYELKDKEEWYAILEA